MKSMEENNTTVIYYNNNAYQYFQNTVHVHTERIGIGRRGGSDFNDETGRPEIEEQSFLMPSVYTKT